MWPLDLIGTDPTHAVNFNERTVDLGMLGLGKMGMAQALQLATSAIRDVRIRGVRPVGGGNGSRGTGIARTGGAHPLKYKARELSGIWATAPYLHNGSVPSLYELLLPADQRSKRFYVGNAEFDPKHVGLRVKPFQGGFETRDGHPRQLERRA